MKAKKYKKIIFIFLFKSARKILQIIGTKMFLGVIFRSTFFPPKQKKNKEN